MLVLTRKTDDQIHVGDNVIVRVLSIHARCVRLGIEAPASIGIRRAELLLNAADLPESGPTNPTSQVERVNQR